MSKKIKNIRAVGQITQDMEPLLQELMYDHDLQWGEILSLVRGYLEIHYPEGQEIYTADKSKAQYYYGHKSGLKK